MKVSKTKFMIWLLFLCCIRFFVNKPYIYGVYYLDVIFLMMFAWCLLGVIACGVSIPVTRSKNSVFCYPIFAFWGLTFVEIVYSYVNYPQSIQSVIKMSYFHFGLCVYFVLIALINSKEKLNILKYSLIVFCTFCNIYQIIYFVLYSTSWHPYFYLALLSMPVAISYFIYGMHKKLTCLNLFTTVICVFFIGENTAIRIAFVVVIVCTVTSYFINKIKGHNNKMLMNAILFMVIAISILGGLLGGYIESMLSSEVGNQIRIYAMEYYWKRFLDSHLLGMGFVDPNSSKELYNFVHGGISPLGGISQYYIEDVGVIGYIGQFGMAGMFVLIWIVKRFYDSVKQMRDIFYYENLGMFAMFFVMFLSLMPTNKAPMQMFPIMLAMVAMNVEFYKP